MSLYAFKEVVEDGKAPDGAIPTKPNGHQYRVGQCLQYPHAIVDGQILKVGMKVLCTTDLSEIPEYAALVELFHAVDSEHGDCRLCDSDVIGCALNKCAETLGGGEDE